MTTKEKIKKEIDILPEELLTKVYEFLYGLKSGKANRNRIKTFKLKGRFDHLNIRKEAYE